MDVPEPCPVTNIPCDLLLILARELDPEDYLNFSAVSKKIRNCLKTGKYSQAEIEDAKNFILQQKKKLKEMLDVVRKDPFAIKNFPNAPEKVKLAAVQLNGEAIRYISNPSEAVKLAAVKRSWKAIEYIDNPSDEMSKIAAAGRTKSYKTFLKASRGRRPRGAGYGYN